MDARDNELPAIVVGYFNRLRKLPVGAWADAGRNFQRAERAAASREKTRPASARATLQQLTGRMPALGLLAQARVRDMAEIAGSCLNGDAIAAMRRAAITAALALANRESLGETAFKSLYGPFEPFIPYDELRVPGPEQLLMTPG